MNANEGGAAVREIARSRALVEEVRDILPALEALCVPGSPEEIITVLVEESAAFGIGARGGEDPEWAARWATYLRALDGMPTVCVREAFDAWNRGEMYPTEKGRQAFYPRPAEVHALAMIHRTKLALMRHRARDALKLQEAKAPPPRERMSKAEMIAAGFLNEDGSVNMGKPKTTTQAAYAALRENSAAARRSGMPVSAVHAGGSVLGDEEVF